MKRGIGVLLCCLTVMGMFSVSGLSVQAAQGTHPNFIVGYEICKDSWEDDDYHYELVGTVHECPSCGYSYWENLQTKKESHKWVQTKDGIECSVCGRDQ